MDLKMTYGDGLTLILQTKRKEDTIEVRNAVTRKFAGILLKSCIGERLEFDIPRQFVQQVDRIVEFIVDSMEEDSISKPSKGISHLVENWNLSEASMESLFYKLHNLSENES